MILAISIGIEINVIHTQKGRYHLKEFKISYGAIIEGLNTNTTIGRYWNPLNLIRWALTIVVLVFLNQHSFAQIFILLIVSVIFQIMMIIAHPMADGLDQRINLMIEVSVSIYLYVLLSLSDLIEQNTFREEKGWVLTIITGLVVAINVLVFLWKTMCRAVAYIKNRFAHLFNSKARKGQYEDSEQ